MEQLAARFEEHRDHLRAVAYRMLGSKSEAEDAVQEAWLRLQRADPADIANLGGWLTTVVSRVCLDLLRSRESRREESIAEHEPVVAERPAEGSDPERELVLADSVGVALLVVLNTLEPAERLAFVLHDLFAVPFEEVAEIMGRTPVATRQLASRARRRVRGAAPAPNADRTRQREVVGAFLSALQSGDLGALIAVLDPELVVGAELPGRTVPEIRGAESWARGAIEFSRLARASGAELALVDGSVGVLMAPGGKLFRVLKFEFADGRIVRMDVIGSPDRLQELDLSVLED